MERTRRNVRKETYRAILEQLCRKIRAASVKGQKSAMLSVPPFVLGYPPFDVTQAVSLRFQARVGDLLTVSAFSRAQMDSAVGDTLLAGQGYGAAAGLQGTFSVTSAVPEPASVALVLAGLAVVAALTRRRPR